MNILNSGMPYMGMGVNLGQCLEKGYRRFCTMFLLLIREFSFLVLVFPIDMKSYSPRYPELGMAPALVDGL